MAACVNFQPHHNICVNFQPHVSFAKSTGIEILMVSSDFLQTYSPIVSMNIPRGFVCFITVRKGRDFT